MTFLQDQHIHSNFSPDGKNTIDEMCEAAIQKGLSTIAITDHCEINAYYEDQYDKAAALSAAATREAAEKYKGRLEVLRGVELGQATQGLTCAGIALDSNVYDIVVASMHNLPGLPDFFYIDYRESEYDPDALFARYLDEIVGMIDWGRFDTLAHLTYPLRYMEGKYGIRIDLQKHADRLAAVFERLVKSGKALEINTSGYRQALRRAMPDERYLRLYRAQGGRLLTIGSDSHRAEDVGANIKDGIELAKSVGFQEIAVFRSHVPTLYRI